MQQELKPLQTFPGFAPDGWKDYIYDPEQYVRPRTARIAAEDARDVEAQNVAHSVEGGEADGAPA